MRSATLLLAVFMAATTFPSTTFAQAARPYDLQGHRGCRGLMPENTIPAFLKALDLGVTTLELDVVISQDKQVVVSHEPYFNPDITTDPTGRPVDKKAAKTLNLYQMPYADIRRYDVGLRGNPAYPEQQKMAAHKPLLREVIAAAEAHAKAQRLPAFSYNIEIKSVPAEYTTYQPEPAEFCRLVYAVISEQLPPDRVILQSFDFAVLRHWKAQTDAGTFRPVRLAALVADVKGVDAHLTELGFTPAIYSPYFQLLSRDNVADAQKRGMKVVPWTVNKPDDMRRLLGWGVDGLITDYPDRARGL